MLKRFGAWIQAALLGVVLTVSTFHAEPAHAVAAAATEVRILFSQANVTTSAWLTLVQSTVKSIKGLTVLNTSPVPLLLAIGASGAESTQLVLPSCQVPGTGVCTPYPQFYPIPISQSQKVAIEALNSTGTSGEIQMNLFYY